MSQVSVLLWGSNEAISTLLPKHLTHCNVSLSKLDTINAKYNDKEQQVDTLT